MQFPENLKYNREHLWVKLEGDIAYVGITDYAQDQLGEVPMLICPNLMKSFQREISLARWNLPK